MSKPSRVRPGLGPPGPQRGQRLGGELRGEEDRQPAVGQLAGELDVLRADGGQVGADVLADRGQGQLERLAGPVRQRQPVVGAVEARRSAGRARLSTTSRYSRVRASGLSKRTPCQPSETCGPGHAEPEPEPAAGQHVEARGGHRRHGRGAGRDLHHRRPDVDGAGLRGQPGQDGRAVRAVRLGGPDDRVPEGLGVPGERGADPADLPTRRGTPGSVRAAFRHTRSIKGGDPLEPPRRADNTRAPARWVRVSHPRTPAHALG